MSLSLPRASRHTGVVAVGVTLLAVLGLLGPGGAAPAHAYECGTFNNVAIHSADTNLAVALPKPYNVNGTRPIMWGYWGGLNQRWCAVPTGNRIFAFRNIMSDKCLTADGTATSDTIVNQQTCVSGSTKQQWAESNVPLGWALRNLRTGGCLDVVEKNKDPGALLQTWGCNYSAWNQSWVYR